MNAYPSTADIRTHREFWNIVHAEGHELEDLVEAARAALDLWNRHGLGDDENESEPVYAQLNLALVNAEIALDPALLNIGGPTEDDSAATNGIWSASA